MRKYVICDPIEQTMSQSQARFRQKNVATSGTSTRPEKKRYVQMSEDSSVSHDGD